MFARVESYESTFSAASSELQSMEESRSAFEAAETPLDLQRLTIAFLRGELTATCYHMAPPLAESNEIVDKLVRINELGLITTGSQPGCTSRLGKPRQRCYVEGILKHRYLNLFRHLIAKAMNNEVFVVSGDTGSDGLSFEEIKHLKHEDLYWVTVDCLDRGAERGLTHISEWTGACEAFQTCSEVYPTLVEEYVNIFIFDTVWGRKDKLLTAVADVLQTLQHGAMIAERRVSGRS